MKSLKTPLLATLTTLALVLAVSVTAVAQEDEFSNLEEALLNDLGYVTPSTYVVDDFDCSYDEDRDDDGVLDVDDVDDDNDGIADTEDADDDNDGIGDFDDSVDDLSCAAEFEVADSSSSDADVDVDVDLDDDGVVNLDDEDDDNDGVVDLNDEDDNNDGIVDFF